MAQQDMMTYTKKMPCPSIGISAELCQTGSKLRKQKGTPVTSVMPCVVTTFILQLKTNTLVFLSLCKAQTLLLA